MLGYLVKLDIGLVPHDVPPLYILFPCKIVEDLDEYLRSQQLYAILYEIRVRLQFHLYILFQLVQLGYIRRYPLVSVAVQHLNQLLRSVSATRGTVCLLVVRCLVVERVL